MSLLRGLYHRWQQLVHELAKFGVVGAVCYVIQLGVFNLLRHQLGAGPITSTAVAIVVAATCAYFGNRHWSFRHRASTGFAREYTLFFVVNGAGLIIAVGCVGFSHYILGLRSAVADNISANLVGTALGTLFRFWAYRRYVFLHPEVAATRAPGGSVRDALDGELTRAAGVAGRTGQVPSRAAAD